MSSFRLSIRCTLRRSTLRPTSTMESLRRRRNLFKFAHLSLDVSSTFGSRDVVLSRMNRVGNLTTETIAMMRHCGKCFTLKTKA